MGVARRLRAVLLAAAAFAAASALPAVAQDATWKTGSGNNTDYGESTNWDNGTPPTAGGQSAIFDASGSTTIVVGTPISPDAWTFTPGAQGYSISGSPVSFGAGGITFSTTTNATTITNDIAGTGGVAVNGGATLTLAGTNSYSGTTTVSAGILEASSIGTGQVTLNGGTLAITATSTLDNAIQFSGGSGVLAAATGTMLTLTGNTGPIIYDAGAVATFGSTTYTGTVVYQVGANQSFGAPPTASIVVAGGTLQAGDTSLGELLKTTTSTTVNSGATLDFGSQTNQIINNLKGAGTVNTNLAYIPNGGLKLAVDDGGSTEFSGAITGTGAIVVSTGTNTGSGKLILSGTSTYTGGTVICACGVLQIGNGGTTGSIANNDVLNDGKLIFNRSDSYTFSGAIFGSGSVEQAGGASSVTVLGSNNTYSGGTTITSGILQVTAGTGTYLGLPSSSVGTGTVTLNGGTFQSAGTADLAFTNNFAIGTAGGTIDTNADNPGRTLTLSGVISNGSGTPGQLTLADTFTGFGTIILSGTNTYSGGTTITNVTAQVTNNSSLGTGAVTLNGGQLQNTQGATNITLANNFTIGTFGGFVDANGGVLTLSGNITGTGAGRLQVQDSQFGFSYTVVTGTVNVAGGVTICNCASLSIGDGGTTGSVTGDIANGGVLVFNRSDRYVFSGQITDDGFDQGTVLQFGSGTTVLAADNTYTNSTTVQNGKLIIGNGGTNGSILFGVSIGSGATFGVDRSDTYTLTNSLTGAGNFEQLGTGTTIFANAKAYTGTTTISAGTLQIGNGGAGGSIASTAIIDNGTLAINKSNGFNLNATVSGTGGLNQIGTGTTTLNAATTYSGATNVTAGVLRAGAANVFSANSAFNVGASGTLNLFNFNQTIGSLAGSGAVTLTTETLTTGADNTSTTFSGTIAGAGGLTKTGTGNFIYTGTSAYTGATTVNGGTLSINGSLVSSSGVTVNSGGILGGTGTLPGTTINSGGALAPGNSIGTIAVNGNLTFNAGSSYNVELSPSASDRTNVTGTATLGNATLAANFASGTYIAKQYTILNATSISGTFGALTKTNLPANFVASLSYDTSNAYLDLVLGLPNFGTGLTTNQQNVGNALTNYFNANGGIPALYGTLTANGLTQTAGEPGANIPQAGFAAMNQFINAMMDSSGGNGAPGGGLGFAQNNDEENAYAPKRKLSPQQTDAYAAVTPRDRMPTPFASRWNVWATGYGGNSTISGDATTGSHATSTRVYGTAVGADYRATPDTRFGFALGGAGTSFTVDSALGGGRADVFQAGAYAKHTMGAAYIAGALAYAWQDVTTDRTVTASGTDKLRAQLKANALSARLEGGWRTAMLPVAVTPYAALRSTAFYLPSYAETATSGSNQFALSYGSKTITATRAELGARFDKAVPVNDALLTLRARTAWAHDWNTDRSALATFQSLPGATFTVNGAQPSANAALLSAGADLAWGNGWTIAASFDGELSRTTRGYAGKGSLRYAW